MKKFIDIIYLIFLKILFVYPYTNRPGRWRCSSHRDSKAEECDRDVRGLL